MQWRKWSIARPGSGDFMPTIFGTIMMLVSVPAFIMLIFFPDTGTDTIRYPLIILMGFGVMLGGFFVILGVRVCSLPGSWPYRITHGRIFTR